jgi:leucyl aminopeptidase (aminopeptidase T)
MDPEYDELNATAAGFVRELLCVRPGWKVLIYRDRDRPLELSEALRGAAERQGARVEMHEIDRKVPIEESASKLENAIEGGGVDAICELSEQYFYQSSAWKNARKKGVKAYSLAGLDADAFVRCVGRVDQKKMFEFGQHLAGTIKSGRKVEIKSSAGTAITCEMHAPSFYKLLPLRWRPKASTGSPSGYLGEGGSSTFMGGQLAFQAIRKSISGTAVIDAYFWPPDEIGEFDSGSVILTLVKGEVVRIEGCERKSGIIRRWFGSNPMPIKHFCLGFNPGARLSGKILEAKRVYGTISIGVGDYPLHTDGIISKPTILIDGKCIAKDGEFTGKDRNDLSKSGDPTT